MYTTVKKKFDPSLCNQLLNTYPQFYRCLFLSVLSILGMLGPFVVWAILFCHPFGGCDSLKKARIPEEVIDFKIQWRTR